jgi:hypothetical protein
VTSPAWEVSHCKFLVDRLVFELQG